MIRIAAIAGAGALGTLARYGIQQLLGGRTHPPAVWGTLVVNVLGCLAFGLVWGWLDVRGSHSPDVRAIFLTGFCGAFTTFSALMYDSGTFARDGAWSSSLLVIVAHVGLGAAAMAGGFALARVA